MRLHTLFIIIYLFGQLFAAEASAQVDISMKMDTNQILIGEQVRLHLNVSAGINDVVVMPEYPDSQLVKGIEVLRHYTETICEIDNGKRRQLVETYVITSFDSAHYTIPPMEVVVAGTTHKSKNSLPFNVFCPVVDTLHLDKFYGPTDNIRVIFNWDDLRLPFLLWLLSLILFIASCYIGIQIKNNHRIIPKLKFRPEGPPHKLAFRQIEKLRQKKTETPDEAHTYYTELTDILRLYIERRYEYKATAMTSAEIITKLQQYNDTKLIDKLRNLLESVDLVKYAGLSTAIDDINHALATAIEYVDATKETEGDRRRATKPKEEPLVKRSRLRRNILLLINWLIALAAIALFACTTIIISNYI